MSASEPATVDRMSSGLVYLTKLHSQRSLSVGTVEASVTGTSESTNDNSWSWKHLQSEFQAKDAEKLFKKYQVRLQHNFFIVLLMFNFFFNIVAIAVYFFDEGNKGSFPGPVVMRASSLVVYVAFFILTCLDEEWLKPTASRVLAAVTVLVAMVFSEHGSALYNFIGEDEALLQRIRPTFYIIIANHVFLPFPSRIYGFVATIIIIAIEIGLTINTRFISDCPSSSVYRYIAADIVFYATSAAIGFILTYLLEIANRRAFLDHRRCIQSKFKLEFEKDQQDQLLNSCLPQHLSERVRNDIRVVFSSIEKDQQVPPRPFNELYVEKYKNVSILYADIVNSMLLANKLTPCELVETLNELFGRFDDTAEKNNCLRIKLLGDCYYCVSGVPTYDPDHAINCVRMGLEMIRIIKSVRDARDVDVNMRIGIHSGMVLSGMLGLHKWQYDIWSQDSMKASAMEHDGVPGFVHVTKTTYDLLPPAEVACLRVRERRNSGGETTYLLDQRSLSCHLRTDSASPLTQRRGQAERLKNSMGRFRRSSSLDSIYFKKKRTTHIKKYSEMMNRINEVMESDIDSMPLSKRSQWLDSRGINPLFLTFNKDPETVDEEKESLWTHERRFAAQSDPLFRYYLYCSGLLCVSILLIKLIVPKMITSAKLQWSLGATVVIIIASLICTYPRPEKLCYGYRILIWLVVSAALVLCSAVDVVSGNCLSEKSVAVLSGCSYAWYYTFCMIMSITSVTLFIRINLWLKFALHITSLLIYISLTKSPCSVLSVLDRRVKWNLIGSQPHIGHLYYICIVTFLLHVIDRQIEYILRLDYQWTEKLDKERKEALIVGDINRILIENILPIHVAEKYLHSTNSSENLYHESYDSISVMFASIPNYLDFYTENNINDDGLKCLLLLNEIICDFDKLLHNSTRRIEKIKTIGSTYMAAAGLLPGRASNESDESVENISANVLTLVNYATAMMETIQRINRDALQDFKLRVGIAVGPVIAGIVGAVKPQYDIWGDTVNVASRMESTGITGRIQVTKAVADIVVKSGRLAECRGPIMVKGKGQLVTYLLVTPYDCDEVESTKV